MLLSWIFEGRRYRGYSRCLALEWNRLAREARYLLATHNPRWRVLDAPEGEVDWLTELHRELYEESDSSDAHGQG